MKIKKGNTVLIISGKDRGKKGKILRAFPKERRVMIEGVNLIKRHQKPKKKGEKGQIIEMPAPIDVSNVKLICSKCGKTTRTSYKTVNEKKYLVCKKCGKET
ncbi:MAG: 50S ribosomal protein L24 [Patescibacteria group bacterium]|nr:50S ribosomal protein L24 [Patescibacteria group bacterium]